ncbi:glycosyltransferase family protein [Parahaliea mediterranea]|uniref:glycosyltransferase family protein n=1 Tax=Parahaliea mediterranea TaxID=651086 RepID=UPI000E2FD533|nr:glycosyltransferase family protein [Parahaliea mediterranea]
MRILYGVQATGQGHISRARAMARAFQGLDIQVDWLFTGRPRERLFDMEPFGHFQHRRGLTFATRAGGISYLNTVLGNNLFECLRDARSLSLGGYDAIVTDFEPVSAWAGRLAGVRTIGIGHQYAFGEGTPVSGGNALSRFIMRHFAPVDVPLGLHWHPYASNVLPPILDLPDLPRAPAGHILVYLPFEDQAEVTRWLQQFPGQRFLQYAAGLSAGERGNVQLHPTSISAFKRDLASSNGVICNSGFELISECLQWRKPVLTKPLAGQMEQLSNARALQELGYARVIHSLNGEALKQWLASTPASPTVHYQRVHEVLARWLASGASEAPAELARRLWPQPAASTWHSPAPALGIHQPLG